jgi:hypothetical protein
MFKTLRSFGLAAALVALSVLSVSAQTTVTATTLSNAVAAGDATVTLASATGVAVGTQLFVDLEAMTVTAISSTLATVTRGVDGTMPAAHAAAAAVYAGSTGSNGPFVRANPPVGTCVATTELFNLRINTRTGDVWRCLNSNWATVNDPRVPMFRNYPGIGAAVASVAGVIAPTSGFFHITGTAAITGITVPTGCEKGCQITIIPDGAFTTTTATNIALASTGVVSKALIMTYDPVAVKWYPSY